LKSDNTDETNACHRQARDKNGMTGLISKAANGDLNAVKRRLAEGADPSPSDNQRFTA
jgi:ankyrin repeat protein